MTGMLLPICSIIFSGLLCCVYFSKKRIKLQENDVYGVMLIASFIDSILVSILQLIPINGIIQQEYILVEILNKIDFIMLILFTNNLFLYTMLITYKNTEKYLKKIIKISVLIDAIMAIALLLGNVEVISQAGNYSIEGKSIFATIIVCGMYLLGSLIIAIINIKKADKRYIPIFSIIGIALFLILMFNLNPYLIIISITLTFINYLMYFTIENPDVKMIEQLDIAKTQAEKANRAKTEFLSSMSHEIRTPLNAIVGFSDYIISSESLDEAKENAKDIVNASQTLLEIVNSILDISKIEAGKLEIVNSKYNAKNTFESLAKLISPKMNEKGLDFSYYIAPDLPETLYGDHANIKKVVTNLLSNAYKYTDKGSVRYEVNCVNSQDKTKLIITVEDTGRGIKQESIDKLFTKFQRLEEDRNTTIEGTGLGLAITKQLTELMGGKILVHTVYGEGSKFTIVLDQRIELTQVENEVKEIKTTLDLKNKKILIVDDNELNLKVASKILGRYNANNITTITNGFECFDRIKKGEVYDIILLDDMMPKMTGPETLKELRRIPGFNQPVVVLTANAIAGMKEKYLNEGFDEYLAKPIEKDELIRVCNFIFEKYKNIPPQVQIRVQEENLEATEELEIIEEELEPVQEEVKENNISPEDYLKENNVDLEKALEFLGDIEMYNMTVNDFLSEVENKWQRINEYKDQNDMPNYAIEVHSLKSDLKYLGFMTLAEIAYSHELKSKENDSTYVNEHFSELEEAYKKVLEITKKYNEMIK